MLPVALEVADRLAAEGIRAAVVDARFVKPLDEDLIAALAAKCGRLVTLEEHARLGGFGSAVLEALAARGLATPVLQIALPDVFIEHGAISKLKELYGLAPGPVFERVRAFAKAGRISGGPA
jgi:1-deoxy-D-xylulose-5-phosphate synthase